MALITTPLFLTNTLGKKKELFTPLSSRKVGIYSCGPTVYDRAHLGNFRYFIFVDILIRALHSNGLTTKHVLNITDVGHLTDDADEGEDKIEKVAKETKKKAWDIAHKYTHLFFEDAKRFNILPQNYTPRATNHIKDQIKFIEKLQNNGFAYQISDGVYFDTKKLLDYGKLIGLSNISIEEGARVAKNPEKRNPTDFALWKFSPKDSKREMEWPSPWGVGFPGWHIECSAISKTLLGFPFDIHTGGIDHIPVHHTNELAQNEGAGTRQTAQFWMHSEFMTVDGTKMSKSLKNTYTLQDLLDRSFSPLSFRYLVLSTHYRQILSFTWESLSGADNAYKNLIKTIARITLLAHHQSFFSRFLSSIKKSPSVFLWNTRFREVINDDLNTPQALAILHEMLRENDLSPQDKIHLIKDFDAVLGLNLAQFITPVPMTKEIQKLLTGREKARKEERFHDADIVRREIEDKGFILEDTPEGPLILPKL